MSEHPSAARSSRAIFLDIDGTYADYGIVPEGHARAVREARAAGHKVFLCTGRPVPMLSEDILGAGFDGVVASAGAFVELDGQVLVDRCFPPELAARTLAVLDGHRVVYCLEAQEEIAVPPQAWDRLREIIGNAYAHVENGEQGLAGILAAMRPVADRAAFRFAKVSVFESPIPMGHLTGEIGDGIAVVANSVADGGLHSGELYLRGISKADGIAAVIEHLGIAREDTIAVGDGANDLEMIAFAGVGIAIEGSHPELVAIADLTAAPPRQEGLVAVFSALGLLG